MKKIPLTQGKFALVDNEDYDWLMQWKWYALKSRETFYAARTVRQKDRGKISWPKVFMHREILGLRRGDHKQGDHRSHNGLDNRRQNIRKCSHAENTRNLLPLKGCSSQYKGVRRRGNKWSACVQCNGKDAYLGTYKVEIEAAKAYDAKARELFGEFALPNFPEAM